MPTARTCLPPLVGALLLLAAGCAPHPQLGASGHRGGAHRSATGPPAPSQPAPATKVVHRKHAAPQARKPPATPRPPIVLDPIPFGPARRRETAAYSLRHYGTASFLLRPRVIVLHFTASGSYASVHATFAADTPNLGELPGTCAHYVVDQDGTIYQLVRPTLRCRHTIGLNDVAIGIEMVQETGPSSSWADRQILARGPQIRAALALVRWLQARFEIATTDVIGHAMANDSPLFHDRLGWRNDHTDWLPADVAAFRRRLGRR